VNLLRCIFCGYCQQACPTGAITLENIYELSSLRPDDLVYHKEQLLEPEGTSTRGAILDWTPTTPEETTTPIPSRQGFFDGLEATATAVGQANLPAEQQILLDAETEPATHPTIVHSADKSSTSEKSEPERED